jgi:uncharacterized membrane protein
MPWQRSGRFWRHLVTDDTDARRAVPADAIGRIEQAIAAGERNHRGQLCLAIEAALPLQRVWQRQTPRERALEVFGLARVWDTEENCGVLVYLLFADRDVEIVADRGIDRAVDPDTWQSICATMERSFRDGRFADGLVAGVGEINALLQRHFPRTDPGPNELPDRVRFL